MTIQESQFPSEEIQKNHAIYLERSALYKEFGFDREEAEIKIVNCLLKDLRSILEIGTGKGYLTTMLAKSFDRVFSVDIDSNEQRIAGLNAAYYKQLNRIEFISADAGKLEYPDKSFDAVVSAFTFHHLELPFKVLSEMIRLANRQVVISDFNRKGFDIVEKIHHREGKTHEIQSGHFDIVGVYLKEFNFNVKIFEYEHQIIYSAVKI